MKRRRIKMLNRSLLKYAVPAAIAVSALAASACSSSASSTASTASAPSATASGAPAASSITIGISSAGQSYPFVAGVVKAMQADASAMGIKVVITDAQENSQKQTADIQDLISEHVNGIILLPVDGVVAESQVNMITAAGIPVVAEGSKVGTASEPQTYVYPKLVAYVAESDTAVGQQAASAVTKLLPNGGDIGIILGAPGYAENTTRVTPFVDALKATGKPYKIVSSQSGQWTPTGGQSVCQNVISSNANVKAFYALSDDMAIGCSKAITAAKSDAQVIGVGGYKEILALLKPGSNVAASVCFNPLDDAKQSVNALVNYIEGKDKQTSQLIATTTFDVTSTNISSCHPVN
jgi:ABC-type sugar transport system substrate-binding protein